MNASTLETSWIVVIGFAGLDSASNYVVFDKDTSNNKLNSWLQV